MTLKSKTSRQVSLDFKKLPLNVADAIENKSLDTSCGPDDSDECRILYEEKCKSKKIDNYFQSVSKTPSCLKRKKNNLGCFEDPASKTSRLEKTDVGEEDTESEEEEENKENEENSESKKNGDCEEQGMELMEISSSDSEDEEDEVESEESDTSESDSKPPSCEASGENAGNVNLESKAEEQTGVAKVACQAMERKKRRPSSIVEAERKAKELMRARRRVEKEKQRLERAREREREQLEKLAKRARKTAERAAAKQLAEKEKEEKRLKREEEKRIKEEKEAQILKEKEDKRQKREEEKREKELLKNKERLKKEEERKKREEEKLHEKKEREEAKRLEQERETQEEQRRVSRQAAFFSSFFRKDAESAPAAELEEERSKPTGPRTSGLFNQFHIKKGMQLAPISHHAHESRCRKSQEMERAVLQNSPDPSASLYLTELRTCIRKPICIQRRRKYQTTDKDVELIDPISSTSNRKWYRVKILQFKEDVRPPYYGTFRQLSRFVTGRSPFAKDPDLRNYEVDSEEEWEEPEDGESLSNSDNEEEEAIGDEGDDDNDGFFVPHGYLSEDEGVDGEEDDLTPEMRKAKQQLLQQRFEAAMLRKLQPLQNVLISPAVDHAQHPLLKQFKIIELTNDFPIPTFTSAITPSASGSKITSKFCVPEEAMPYLIRLVSGNSLSMKKILFEFRMFWELKQTGNLPTISWEEDLKGREWEAFSISKTRLEKKIREFTKREDGCWRVSPEMQSLHLTEEKPWDYVTDVLTIRKKRKSSPVKEVDTEPEVEAAEKVDLSDATETPSKVKRSSIMTFFVNQEPGQPNKDITAKSPLPGQENKDTNTKSPKSVVKSGPLTKFTAVASPFATKPDLLKITTTEAKPVNVVVQKNKSTSKSANNKITDSQTKTIPIKSPTKRGPKKKATTKKAVVNVKSDSKRQVSVAHPDSKHDTENNRDGKISANCDGIPSLNSPQTKLKVKDRTLQNVVEVIDLCD